MPKFSLGTRLFFSHLTVMLVGLASFVILAKLSSPRMFLLRLEQLENQGFITVRSARTYLVKGFETAWNSSAFWAVIFGASAAGGLSYLAAERICQPLKQMKEITQKLAAGNLEERMPETVIPEFNQLGKSFNVMASSLEDVEQRRRDLISDLTHELRSPLTVVRGYLEELADGNIGPSPELYQRLVGETRRLERLTRDLQELSKAEAGYLTIRPQVFPIYPLLEALVEKFQDQIPEEGPELVLESHRHHPLVFADPDRTEQILVNLLGNAIRYTETGAITLKTWVDPQNKSQLWIAVTDTGVGISAEDLPHVFERFWRADKSRSRHSGGTGIGLAIVQRLAELQGGAVAVQSVLGEGSEFRFSLPLALD
ncbi:MAG: sensor histidine kinase [Cyanobacteriota bacterium]|jgi:signal transduction histidine kinase